MLDAYIERDQPAYGWEHLEAREMPGGVTMHRLQLTSQTWMGRDWTHPLNLLVPSVGADAQALRTGYCVLVITAGDQEAHAQICAMLAGRLNAPIAVLHHVPNQPLLPEKSGSGRGLWEDALIAQTFLEFSQTGNSDWPLLLPMARSAVSAMDALGEFSHTQAETNEGWVFDSFDKFITTGASKRGWTTWLSAVADDRVVGIAPMVYDNLNLEKQIPLHYASWGEPSPSIHDYTERGLLEILKTERGRQIVEIVDPFSYWTVSKCRSCCCSVPTTPTGRLQRFTSTLTNSMATHGATTSQTPGTLWVQM